MTETDLMTRYYDDQRIILQKQVESGDLLPVQADNGTLYLPYLGSLVVALARNNMVIMADDVVEVNTVTSDGKPVKTELTIKSEYFKVETPSQPRALMFPSNPTPHINLITHDLPPGYPGKIGLENIGSNLSAMKRQAELATK
jgi:hypothetical protein